MKRRFPYCPNSTGSRRKSIRLEAAQDALSKAQETGSGNTQKLQNDINELTAAQEVNAQQIAELEEASREYGKQQTEVAQILAAIVQGGEEDIVALNEQLTKIEEGKENFSNTVAEMETNFSDRMEEIVQDLEDAIQGMDLADEMYQIGENNLSRF